MEEVKSWHKVRITNRHARSSNFYNNNGRDSVGWFGADVSAVALQMPIFFICLFCFGVIWCLWENTTHHSLWLLIVSIVKIDTDNRSTWDSTYRPLCDALLLTLARISSLSFDANANEQTADADKNIGILSIRATQEWSFKTNSRFEQEVEKKSKWKLMDFVAKTCIQIRNHDHEHMQRANKWGNVKCA